MKKVSSRLVFLSGMIILILGGIHIFAWIFLLNFVQSVKTVSPSFMPIVTAFMNSLRHPIQMVIPVLTILVGVILVVASKKMKTSEKLFHWSVVSLILGLVVLFELNGGIFGGTTAVILSSVGGIFGLIESTKKTT